MNQWLVSLGASAVWDRLLGLTELSWSDPNTNWGWRHPIPDWGWMGVICGAGLLAAWSYSRLAGRRRYRASLAVMRWLLLVVIACLLIGPVLIHKQELVEPDVLFVLVDRSASMQIQDEAAQDGTGHGRVTREQAMVHALAQNPGLFGPKNLGRDRHVTWLGFDQGTYPIGEPDSWKTDSNLAVGGITSLRTAVEQALQLAAGRPISSIVMFSDGRSHQATGQDLVRRLQQEITAVFAVPIGDPGGIGDLAIAQIVSPQAAYVKDTVPVRVWVDFNSATTQQDQSMILVSLRDSASGDVLDEREVSVAELSDAVQLTGQSQAVGLATWQVDIRWASTVGDESGGSSALELVEENNHQKIEVDFVDRPIRVLYVEGYPRWEYRYLQGVLKREKSILSSVLLVSADRGFVQEGDKPIARFPQTPKELGEYDVVIIGDVAARYFEQGQLEMLRDHIASHGMGLVWIGGSHHTPGSYMITPVRDLFPMRRTKHGSDPATVYGPITMTPTPLAGSLQVMRLSDPGLVQVNRDSGWPMTLPPLTWAQDLSPLVQTAEVLAVGARENAEDIPLITRMRYGAGQSIYLATDETWRWRYGMGDVYFERFWVQLIRMLGRHRLQGTGHETALIVSNRRLELGQTTLVQLRSTGEFSKVAGPKIVVEVLQGNEVEGLPSDTKFKRVGLLDLQPVRDSRDEDGQDLVSTRYEALWRPRKSGKTLLRVVEPLVSRAGLEVSVEVITPDDELKHPLPDHGRLASLAEATGGQVVPLHQLNELANLVPNRARRTPNDISEALWDSPISFLLVIILITAEWVGRKLIRLV